MKSFFFLAASVAVIQTSYATTTISESYTMILEYADHDGNSLPQRTGNINEERTGEKNEWRSIIENRIPVRRSATTTGKLEGSTIAAQNEPRIATSGHDSSTGRTDEQSRSGEHDRTDNQSRILAQTNLNVQPAEIACPRSALAATSLSEPKISPGDLFARLVEEGRIPFKEPTIKDLGVKP